MILGFDPDALRELADAHASVCVDRCFRRGPDDRALDEPAHVVRPMNRGISAAHPAKSETAC